MSETTKKLGITTKITRSEHKLFVESCHKLDIPYSRVMRLLIRYLFKSKLDWNTILKNTSPLNKENDFIRIRTYLPPELYSSFIDYTYLMSTTPSEVLRRLILLFCAKSFDWIYLWSE